MSIMSVQCNRPFACFLCGGHIDLSYHEDLSTGEVLGRAVCRHCGAEYSIKRDDCDRDKRLFKSDDL